MMDKQQLALVGIIVITLAAVLQVVCIFIVRILTHVKHGRDPTAIMRCWLHIAAFLDQVSFVIFHVQYNFLQENFDNAEPCVMLRFLSSMTSSMTNSWLLVMASFYLMLTIKPCKCFTFHARFLSQCVTWTWTCVGSLLYLLLSHMLKEEYHGPVIETCWNNISQTIHMYLTYGNEIIPFVIGIIFITCTRIRLPIKRQLLETFSQHVEYKIDADYVISSTNRLLFLSALLFVYYISIIMKIQLGEGRGSDIVIMLTQAYKGFILAFACFVSPDTLALLRCRSFRETKRQDVVHLEDNDTVNASEMRTYHFET